MKNFYSVEPKHDLMASNRKYDQVEYNINTLIRDEAELCVDDALDDNAWDIAVEEKTNEIKEELMQNGIWRNEFGCPVFLYC